MPYLRGFKNRWRVEYQIMNVGELNELPEDQELTLETLLEAGAISKKQPLKILGDGELTKKLKVSAHRFSKSAAEKIAKAGGETIVLPGPAPVAKNKMNSAKPGGK